MSRYLPVNPRQRKFATAFVRNGGRGGDAALVAGFNRNGAPGVASRLLRNPAVLALIVGDCLRGAPTAPDVLRALQRPNRPVVVKIRIAMLLAAPPAAVRTFGGRAHVQVSSDVVDVADAVASIGGYSDGYNRAAPLASASSVNALIGADNGLSARSDTPSDECAPAGTLETIRAHRSIFAEAGGTPPGTQEPSTDSRSEGDFGAHTDKKLNHA